MRSCRSPSGAAIADDACARCRDAGWARAAARCGRRQAGHEKLAEAIFLPVIPDPHATWALALNFKTHIEETGLTTSQELSASLHAHAGIGRRAQSAAAAARRRRSRRNSITKASSRGDRPRRPAYPGREGASITSPAICCSNEGSVREYPAPQPQFGLGKNFERSGSSGPWLMTPTNSAIRRRSASSRV